MIWRWNVPTIPNTQDTQDAKDTATRADRIITQAIESGQGEWDAEWSEEEGSPSCSRTQIQRLIRDGKATLNEGSFDPKKRLAPGDRIQIRFEIKRTELQAAPEKIPLSILYEDTEIAVINKPAGLTVHPSPSQPDGTLVNALVFKFSELSQRGDHFRPGIVHRLDKYTSGAMVVAKTDRAHVKLSSYFEAHSIDRSYHAFSYGMLSSPGLRHETLIGRHPTHRIKMSTHVTRGKRAVTHFKTLRTYDDFASLIEAKLETGRTHQVRVHLNDLGCSILGDPVYGTPTQRHPKWQKIPESVQEKIHILPGQALIAKTLGFRHPKTNEKLFFEVPYPPELEELLKVMSTFETSVRL